MQVYLLKKFYVLVRGDVFASKFSNWFYRGVRLLPIFRRTDGDPRENVTKNNESFDECYELLKNGKNILIFSEAVASAEKALRPVRKGTARMAFDMESRSDFNLGLHVVPMGINYTHFTGFGKELMVSFGDPISISALKDDYEDSRAKATNQLTKQVADGIRNEVVVIENPELYQVADLYLEAQRLVRQPLRGKFHWNRKGLESETKAADRFNEVVEEDPSIANTLADLGHLLQSNKMKLGALHRTKFPIWSLLFNIVAFPFALVGFILYHFIPILSRNLSLKLAKQKQFHDSLTYGFGMAFFVVVNLIVFIVLAIVGGWQALLFFPLVYVCKYAYFNWMRQRLVLSDWADATRVRRKNKEAWDKMQALNKKVVEINNA